MMTDDARGDSTTGTGDEVSVKFRPWRWILTLVAIVGIMASIVFLPQVIRRRTLYVRQDWHFRGEEWTQGRGYISHVSLLDQSRWPAMRPWIFPFQPLTSASVASGNVSLLVGEPFLESVDVWDVNDASMRVLGEISTLQRIQLQSPKGQSGRLEPLAKLSQLKELELQAISDDAGFEVLPQIRELQSITVSFDCSLDPEKLEQLENLAFEQIASCRKLKSLTLESIPSAGCIKSLSTAACLDTLILMGPYSSELSVEFLREISELKKLRRLRLIDCTLQLSDLRGSEITHLSLEQCQLRYTDEMFAEENTPFLLQGVHELRNLDYLELSPQICMGGKTLLGSPTIHIPADCHEMAFGPLAQCLEQIVQLPHLKTLRYPGSTLRECQSLSKLTGLEVLDVRGTRLEMTDWNEWKKLKSLRQVVTDPASVSWLEKSFRSICPSVEITTVEAGPFQAWREPVPPPHAWPGAGFF